MAGFLAGAVATNTELATAIITVGITLGTIVVAAVVRYWLLRRGQSGQIETSEAVLVWQQAQQMREMLLAEKQRAEDQRDRLLEAQSADVLPALAALNSSMTTVHDILARNREMYTSFVHELQDAMSINRATIKQYGGMVEEMRDAVLAAASRGSPDLPQAPPAGPGPDPGGTGPPAPGRSPGGPGPPPPRPQPRRRRG